MDAKRAVPSASQALQGMWLLNAPLVSKRCLLVGSEAWCSQACFGGCAAAQWADKGFSAQGITSPSQNKFK